MLGVTNYTIPIAPENLGKKTVTDAFRETVARHHNKVALRHFVPKDGDAFDQVSYTWDQYDQESSKVAKSLIALKATGAVTFQGSNCPKLLFANMGAIKASCVSAGIYPTNLADATKHCVLNSKAEVVIVENEEQLKKYQGLEGSAVKCFVVWNAVQNGIKTQNLPAPAYSWDEFLQKGESISDKELQGRMRDQNPNDVCSIIYTSGTTGMPKGAELTHDNLTWTGLVAGHKFKMTHEDHGLSYLPLSHIAAQQVDIVVALSFGYMMDIAPADALKGNNLKKHIATTKPTFFLAVPQVWDKMKEGILEKLKEASFVKKLMFKAITPIARKCLRDIETLEARDYSIKAGRLWYVVDVIRSYIDKFALSLCNAILCKKVKAAMGLDRCRLAASGAAPISKETVDFFAGLNIRIVNLYGMSETSGLIPISSDPDVPSDSCGKPLPGTQVILSAPNEEGVQEIRVKGRNIFRRYRDDEKATQEVFDEQEFFRTGDTGAFDERGNLRITGRTKELIKTSGGENIPPVLIEDTIKATVPYLSHVVVIGDRKKYLTCLAILKTVVDKDNNATDELSKDVLDEISKAGSKAKTLQEASRDPIVQKLVFDGISKANNNAVSAAQKVQKVALLSETFSVANGLMTPTLKLKRGAVNKKFEKEIAELYA